MIGVALLAIDVVEHHQTAGPQVEQALLALAMPDGEGAVVLHGEEQVAAVGADARMADGGRNAGCGELLAACRQHRPDDLWAENGVYLRTQLARLFIEGNAAETVLQLLELLGQLHMRRPAEIDVAAVGREGGEGLESQTVGE